MDAKKKRTEALVALKAAEQRIFRQLVNGRVVLTASVIHGFLFLLLGFWTYVEEGRSELAVVCLVVVIGCAICYCLQNQMLEQLNSQIVSLRVQQVDFTTKETTLIDIREQLATLVCECFETLKYPGRYRIESALETAKYLKRDLQQLNIELGSEIQEVHHWFRELGESEGIARIKACDGFLTTVGFDFEAIHELKYKVDDSYQTMREIRLHSEIDAGAGLRLVIAMQQVAEALSDIATLHQSKAVVPFKDVNLSQ